MKILYSGHKKINKAVKLHKGSFIDLFHSTTTKGFQYNSLAKTSQ